VIVRKFFRVLFVCRLTAYPCMDCLCLTDSCSMRHDPTSRISRGIAKLFSIKHPWLYTSRSTQNKGAVHGENCALTVDIILTAFMVGHIETRSVSPQTTVAKAECSYNYNAVNSIIQCSPSLHKAYCTILCIWALDYRCTESQLKHDDISARRAIDPLHRSAICHSL
jgi:hypothetical protein